MKEILIVGHFNGVFGKSNFPYFVSKHKSTARYPPPPWPTLFSVRAMEKKYLGVKIYRQLLVQNFFSMLRSSTIGLFDKTRFYGNA